MLYPSFSPQRPAPVSEVAGLKGSIKSIVETRDIDDITSTYGFAQDGRLSYIETVVPPKRKRETFSWFDGRLVEHATAQVGADPSRTATRKFRFDSKGNIKTLHVATPGDKPGSATESFTLEWTHFALPDGGLRTTVRDAGTGGLIKTMLTNAVGEVQFVSVPGDGDYDFTRTSEGKGVWVEIKRNRQRYSREFFDVSTGNSLHVFLYLGDRAAGFHSQFEYDDTGNWVRETVYQLGYDEAKKTWVPTEKLREVRRAITYR